MRRLVVKIMERRVLFCIIKANCNYWIKEVMSDEACIVSFLPNILEKNQVFAKEFCLGEVTFESALGEGVFERTLNF